MNFNDIELRLRYPHIFNDQEHSLHSLPDKAVSIPSTSMPKSPALNWLGTFFQQRKHRPT